MKQFRLVNNLVGWIVFGIAAFTYVATVEETASLWDCGEFITSAYKLEVGHPPGAPFFMLLGRFFTLFAGGESLTGGFSEGAGYMVNVMSALCSAFTILFLFWTITHLARRLMVEGDEKISLGNLIAIIGAGSVGALAFTFTDSFWFSAVEGEVYAMSSLFTAAVFWLILKWEDNSESGFCNRWLILIMYLMGLSVGVHLLNLLALPAIALVIYFKKFDFSWKGVLLTLFIAFAGIMVLMKGIVPGIVFIASRFELLFVNGFGAGIHVGTVIYILLLLTVLFSGIYFTGYSSNSLLGKVLFTVAIALLGIPFMNGSLGLGLFLSLVLFVVLYVIKYQPKILNLILTCFLMVFIGYSSFALILIRSVADTPMNQNSPDDVFSLQGYLNREQYGSFPLLSGGQYTSNVVNIKEGADEYDYRNGSYVKTGTKREYIYDHTVFFPRLHSSHNPRHKDAYEAYWVGAPERTVVINGRSRKVPSTSQNISFFINYQMNWMYWRYFMWNFSGRQNDTQAWWNNKIHGNWISGIPFIDNPRLGDQSNIPEHWKNDKGHNVYYMLPLILGLLGIAFQLLGKRKHGYESFIVVSMLFVMTGIAIVVYLNQGPIEPRERDYAYAGSFYAFAIWIGLGVLSFISWCKSEKQRILVGALATVVCLVAVPGILASENWDDHDRSGRYIARDIAYNYLMSCAPNAVIFTYGDNDTFPLWYLQEVEGVRTDVRVCNLSYLQAPWYVSQMYSKAYDSEPLPFTLPDSFYLDNQSFQLMDSKGNKPVNIRQALAFMALNDARTVSPRGVKLIPSKSFSVPVDKQKILNSVDIQKGDEQRILPELILKLGTPSGNDNQQPEFIYLQEAAVLDLIGTNDWERPIYFASTVGSDKHLGLTGYLQDEGMAKRLVPVPNVGMNTDLMYENVMNHFRFGGLETGDVNLDYEASRTFRSLRTILLVLAQELKQKGDVERCKNLLDKCVEVFPESSLSWGYSSITNDRSGLGIASLYLAVGEKEKAEYYAEKVKNESFAELSWFCEQKIGVIRDRSGKESYQMRTVRTVYVEACRLLADAKGDRKIFETSVQDLEDLYRRTLVTQ